MLDKDVARQHKLLEWPAYGTGDAARLCRMCGLGNNGGVAHHPPDGGSVGKQGAGCLHPAKDLVMLGAYAAFRLRKDLLGRFVLLGMSSDFVDARQSDEANLRSFAGWAVRQPAPQCGFTWSALVWAWACVQSTPSHRQVVHKMLLKLQGLLPKG